MNHFEGVYLNHETPEYFQLGEPERQFMQKFLLYDYIEAWTVSVPRPGPLGDIIEHDLQYYLNKEDYETAQLYQDALDRYKKDLEPFG